MQFEVQKYACRNHEYLIYDCNKNKYEFGAREARVMCSQSIGLITEKILVGPVMDKNDMTLYIYNPDGTLSEPQTDDIKVFAQYLEDAGYERTLRSGSGISCDSEEIRKISKMAFFENFIEKYNLKKVN